MSVGRLRIERPRGVVKWMMREGSRGFDELDTLEGVGFERGFGFV
jgi:hypothetical protein